MFSVSAYLIKANETYELEVKINGFMKVLTNEHNMMLDAYTTGFTPKGEWDASTGAYPAGPALGDTWLITVPGTILGEYYKKHDKITFGGVGWFKSGSYDAGDVAITGGSLNGPLAVGGTWTLAAAWTIPAHTLGGAVNANNQAMTNVNIDSGAIDGTPIGANSANTGAFTTLSASGTLTGAAADFSGNITTPGVIQDTHTDATATGNETPDYSGYTNFNWTLTGNLVLVNPSDEIPNQCGVHIFVMGGAGAYTLAAGTDYENIPTLEGATGEIVIVPYYTRAIGQIIFGSPTRYTP